MKYSSVWLPASVARPSPPFIFRNYPPRPVLPPQASLPNCLSTSVSIIASLAATLRPPDPTDRHRQRRRRRRLGPLSTSPPAVPLYISEFPLPIPAFPSPSPTRRRSNFRANGTEAYPWSKLRDERQRCLARLFVNIFSCAANFSVLEAIRCIYACI